MTDDEANRAIRVYTVVLSQISRLVSAIKHRSTLKARRDETGLDPTHS
jgi:hypothetical protein